ncbi:MAG TPA: polysaccharide deacetylase family protein [Chitinophagaceae bacterium]|nr:polysaccharide deacetylase family protein [Chitinophagaceae bacterium]
MGIVFSDDCGGPGNAFYYRFIFFFTVSLFAASKINVKETSISVIARPTGNAVTATTGAGLVQKKKKKIYLTFDDGPNKGTRNVLAIVEQENIPATFFIVGEHVYGSLDQAKTWDSLQAAKNIELCNHSFSHASHNQYSEFYKIPDTVVKDMELTKNKLLPNDQIVRAPGRNSWRIDSLSYTDIKKNKLAIDSLQKAGFIVVGWDLEWRYDPKTLTVKNTVDQLLAQVDSMFNKRKTRTVDNLVLLAHDQAYKTSADSLELREFIQKLKHKDGYELCLVNSYPGIEKLIHPLKTKPTATR